MATKATKKPGRAQRGGRDKRGAAQGAKISISGPGYDVQIDTGVVRKIMRSDRDGNLVEALVTMIGGMFDRIPEDTLMRALARTEMSALGRILRATEQEIGRRGVMS